MCAINLRVSFLLLKSNTLDLVNIGFLLVVERSMKSSTLCECGPLPLCPSRIHLTSFPFFAALPLPCIILNETEEQKGGRPGVNKAIAENGVLNE